MTEQIQGGGFIVARKISRSNIWIKHPLYLKAWIWILGRASHKDHEHHGYQYRRGELVTTYDEIIKATAYHHNRKHIFPTLKQIRIILKWFETEGMITVEPIREIDANPLNSGLGLTGADPRARTRAYIGIKISIVNYDTYQDSENYKGRHKGRPSHEQGHNNNKGTIMVKTPADFSDEISTLKKRYSNQSLIEKCFDAITSTRKTGKVADSILLAQLKYWERYPAEQVESAIRIYLEKDYAGQGKSEKYLLGIVRNHKPAQNQGLSDRLPIREITPENLGALYEN